MGRTGVVTIRDVARACMLLLGVHGFDCAETARRCRATSPPTQKEASKARPSAWDIGRTRLRDR